MAPSTNTRSKPRAQQKNNTSQNSRVTSKSKKDAEKKLKDLQDSLAKAQQRYEKGSATEKESMQAELERQLKQCREQETAVQGMEIDDGSEQSHDQGNTAENNAQGSTEGDKQEKENVSEPVKTEPHEDSLFTSEGDNRNSDSDYSNQGGKHGEDSKESEEEIGLIGQMGALSVQGGKMIKFFSRGVVHYGIFEFGEGNRKKYAIRTIPGVPDGNEYKQDMDMKRDDTSHHAKGTIYQILGVAWHTRPCLSRMDSIAFQNWGKERNGPRRYAPILFILVRWQGKEGPMSWMTRTNFKSMYSTGGTYRGIIGNDKMSIPATVTYDGKPMLQDGEEIYKPDFAIIDSAIRYEKRYDEYENGNVQSRFNRDPTPGAPLQSEQ